MSNEKTNSSDRTDDTVSSKSDEDATPETPLLEEEVEVSKGENRQFVSSKSSTTVVTVDPAPVVRTPPAASAPSTPLSDPPAVSAPPTLASAASASSAVLGSSTPVSPVISTELRELLVNLITDVVGAIDAKKKQDEEKKKEDEKNKKTSCWKVFTHLFTIFSETLNVLANGMTIASCFGIVFVDKKEAEVPNTETPGALSRWTRWIRSVFVTPGPLQTLVFAILSVLAAVVQRWIASWE